MRRLEGFVGTLGTAVLVAIAVWLFIDLVTSLDGMSTSPSTEG